MELFYPELPAGYRYIKLGEILGAGDLYFSRSGAWKECPCPGAKLETTQTTWIRKKKEKETNK